MKNTFLLTLLLSFAFICQSTAFGSTPNLSVNSDNEIVKVSPKIKKFCNRFNKRIKRYKWRHIICNPKTWIWEEKYITPKGYPLVYQIFEHGNPKSTTLIMCGVHGDELPSSYQCIHLVRDILFDNPKKYADSKIIIAPLVNPDGFFIRRPTRQNGRGVDVNRNFPTEDFDRDAIRSWKKKYRSTKRKYPGIKGGSEIETKFQMDLISKFMPDKIISIHSPYGWLDIDATPKSDPTMDEPDGMQYGPFRSLFDTAKDIGMEMSKKSNNFPVTNFKIFPGSLGNYAANERRIPTYTVELPTSSYRKAHTYWKLMAKAYRTAIQYQIPTRFSKRRKNLEMNASLETINSSKK